MLLPAPLGARTSVSDAAPLVVRMDPGGSVGARQAELRGLRRSGQRVEVRGSCYSACVMYLGLRNVCVDPGAIFGFHGPRGVFGALPRDAFEHWSGVMARDLRGPLKGWFLQEARHVRRGFLMLRGAELISMGYERC